MKPENLPIEVMPEIVRRYLDGESVQVLAAERGRNRDQIYQWMFAYVGGGEEYRQLVARAMAKRMADADAEMEGAKTKLQFLKADRKCKYTRMDFERRCPALYGVKQEGGGGGVTYNFYIAPLHDDDFAEAAVIEHQGATPLIE
jgi:hypothetical protein